MIFALQGEIRDLLVDLGLGVASLNSLEVVVTSAIPGLVRCSTMHVRYVKINHHDESRPGEEALRATY